MKKIIVLAVLLVVLHILDVFSTWLGFRLGLEEANPYANAILQFSPLLFWIGGIITYAIISYLTYEVGSQHPKLRIYATIVLLAFVIQKVRPVVWNVEQILIMQGVIL